MSTLLAAVVIIISTAVLWMGSTRLERGSRQIGELHGLPPVVQGSIVIAIGSSFPELASTLLATILHDSFGLGLGIVLGSAVMNVLVIPGVSVLGSKDMRTGRNIVFKEGLFYLSAVLGLALAFALGVVFYPLPGSQAAGLFTREIAILPLALFGVYLLLQWLDTKDHEPEEREDVAAWPAWRMLLVGLVLVVIASEGLVRSVLFLGDRWGVSPFAWGVIVIAVATSLPDAFASFSAAQRGRSVASLANVLGSNVFDVLVILPLGVLIAGSATVDLVTLGPLFLLLLLSTVLLVVFMRTGFVLTKTEGAILLAAYGAFLVAILYLERLLPFV